VAHIVFGLGTSHGPMLSIPPEIWPERVKADRANPQHFYKGRTYTFDELLALRRQEGIAELIRPEVCRDRHMQCQRAISKLADLFDEKRPDVAVVVGNDQMEVFTSEHVPAFAIFWGQYVEGIPRTPEFLAKLLSAKSLYQRILNIVVNPRPFIRTASYFGPDPRRNANLNYGGPERRKGGKADIIKQQALFDKVKMPG